MDTADAAAYTYRYYASEVKLVKNRVVLFAAVTSLLAGCGGHNVSFPPVVANNDSLHKTGLTPLTQTVQQQTFVYVLEKRGTESVVKEYRQDASDLDLRRTLDVPNTTFEIAVDKDGHVIAGAPGKILIYRRAGSHDAKPDHTITVPNGDGSVAVDGANTVYAGAQKPDAPSASDGLTWAIDIFKNENTTQTGQIYDLEGDVHPSLFYADAFGNLYGNFPTFSGNIGHWTLIFAIPAGTTGDVGRTAFDYTGSVCAGSNRTTCDEEMTAFSVTPKNTLIESAELQTEGGGGARDQQIIALQNGLSSRSSDSTFLFYSTPGNLNPIGSDGVSHVYGGDGANVINIYNFSGSIIGHIPANYPSEILVVNLQRHDNDDD